MLYMTTLLESGRWRAVPLHEVLVPISPPRQEPRRTFQVVPAFAARVVGYGRTREAAVADARRAAP